MGKRKERGFSLIELIVVTFILAVGLTSVASLFVVGMVSSRQAERMTAASYEAQQQMERLRSIGFNNCMADATIFKPTDGYTITVENPDKTGSVTFPVQGLPEGQGQIDIAYFMGPTGPYANLKEVTVTISWVGGKPTAGQTILHSYIANRPT